LSIIDASLKVVELVLPSSASGVTDNDQRLSVTVKVDLKERVG